MKTFHEQSEPTPFCGQVQIQAVKNSGLGYLQIRFNNLYEFRELLSQIYATEWAQSLPVKGEQKSLVIDKAHLSISFPIVKSNDGSEQGIGFPNAEIYNLIQDYIDFSSDITEENQNHNIFSIKRTYLSFSDNTFLNPDKPVIGYRALDNDIAVTTNEAVDFLEELDTFDAKKSDVSPTQIGHISMLSSLLKAAMTNPLHYAQTNVAYVKTQLEDPSLENTVFKKNNAFFPSRPIKELFERALKFANIYAAYATKMDTDSIEMKIITAPVPPITAAKVDDLNKMREAIESVDPNKLAPRS